MYKIIHALDKIFFQYNYISLICQKGGIMNLFFIIISLWINYENGLSLSFSSRSTLSSHPNAWMGNGKALLKYGLEIGKNTYGIKPEIILRASYRVFGDTSLLSPFDRASEFISSFSFLKIFTIKNINFIPSIGFGGFTYSGPLYPGLKHYGSATSFIGVGDVCLRKKIKNTNISFGLSLKWFCTLIRNKKTYWFNGYTIFFDLILCTKE